MTWKMTWHDDVFDCFKYHDDNRHDLAVSYHTETAQNKLFLALAHAPAGLY